MKKIKNVTFLLFLLVLISCSKDDPVYQDVELNTIEYNGNTYEIEWGELIYEGLSDDPENPHLNGTHVFLYYILS
ncbi:hypothetical protein [Carboxylicivirga caseinilyticus]|uniref:hypothetical protein n=1 Tax=Carboxylicivirga caseinilyticus TaxID=3417572 RepID=UPI003D3449A0|nr:hypothetical protein [Marinilabiliaceae bacterium A049]